MGRVRVWLFVISLFFTRVAAAQPLSTQMEEASSGTHPSSVGEYLCQSGDIQHDRLCRRTGSVASLLRRTRAAERRLRRPLLPSLLALLCANAGTDGAFSLVYKQAGALHVRGLPTCGSGTSSQLQLSTAEAEAALRDLLPSRVRLRDLHFAVKRHHSVRIPHLVASDPVPTPSPAPTVRAHVPEPSIVRVVPPLVVPHTTPIAFVTQAKLILFVFLSREPPFWLTPALMLLFGLLCWSAGHARGFTRGEAAGRMRGRELALRRVEPGLEHNGLSLTQVVALPFSAYRVAAAQPPASDAINVSPDRVSDPDRTPYVDTLNPYHAPTPALGLPLGTAAAKKSGVTPVEDGLELRRSLLPRPVRNALDGVDALAREVARLWRISLPDEDLRKTLLADPTASATDVLRLLIDIAIERDALPHATTPSFFTRSPRPATPESAPATRVAGYSHQHIPEEVVVLQKPATENPARPCKEWAARYSSQVPATVRALLTTMSFASAERQDDLVWRLASALLRHVAKSTTPHDAT